MSYLIPAEPISIEQQVKRSLFRCSIAHCPDRGAAEIFIRRIALQHKDANHNCWAMIAGPPDEPQGYGMSDDGEPRGCAGKPMFTVLQHSGIGEIAVVVSRWFGGIKLGTGGLARAYSSSVQLGLTALTTILKIHYSGLTLTLPYEYLQTVEYLLRQIEGKIIGQDYSEQIRLELEVPTERLNNFVQEIEEKSQGRIHYFRP